MCGRFTLTWDDWRQVVDALGVQDAGDAFADYRPRFKIAPTDQHLIVTSEFERRKAQHARWGLVNRSARDNSRASQCINAKADVCNAEELIHFTAVKMSHSGLVLSSLFSEIFNV